MRRYSLLFLLTCLLPTGGELRSQEEPKAGTLNVQVKVVNVLATVRDKHGKIVNNLTKDDFILEEDSRPQNIHYFSQETDLPLTLGLLVDTSLSQRRVLDQERNASRSFLDQMLRENKDTAFVIHFDREVELLQDLTSSRQKQRADTVVYSILFSDPGAYGSGGGFGGMGRPGAGRGRYPEQERPDGKKILARISKETGGRLFEVSKKEPIEQIYSQISEELRNQYSLGYTPDRKDAGTAYRKIHLATKQKDLAVQARDGYYIEQ